VLLLLLAPLLVVSALFSGSETAMFGLGARHRMDLKARDTATDRAVLFLLAKPRQLLITMLIGNMAANITWFTIVAVLASEQPWGLWGAIAVQCVGVLILVLFGEVVPKVIASADALRAARFIAPPLQGVHTAVLPLRRFVEAVAVRPLARLAGTPSLDATLRDGDLDQLLDHSAQRGVVDLHEQQFLTGILGLSRMSAQHVMTPRTRMVSITHTDNAATIAETFRSSGLTRLPVRGEDIDEVVGMLFAREWLQAGQPTDIASLLHAPAFTPAVAPVDRVLHTLRDAHRKIAIVVDEYGGTAGIVSIRDLVEPLTGTFDDALAAPPTARPLGPGRWVVDGLLDAGTLMALVGRPIRPGTTFADLIATKHPVAVEGDQMHFGGVRLTVHHVDEDGLVDTVLVSRLSQ
jgi:putative hemolysin